MRIGRGNLLRVCYSKVSHHHLHPGRDSKAIRGVRKFHSKKKEGFQNAQIGEAIGMLRWRPAN